MSFIENRIKNRSNYETKIRIITNIKEQSEKCLDLNVHKIQLRYDVSKIKLHKIIEYY